MTTAAFFGWLERRGVICWVTGNCDPDWPEAILLKLERRNCVRCHRPVPTASATMQERADCQAFVRDWLGQ